jgi:hypothetical protein
MPEKFVRAFSIPSELEERIAEILQRRFSLKLSDSGPLADAVQKMSDYYIENPDDATPWSERWCQIAQLAYYLPLNFLRSQAVVTEGRRFDFFNDVDNLVDFGAGLGPFAWAVREIRSGVKISAVERSADALRLARELGLSFESVNAPKGAAKSLVSFSYSLTELNQLPPWVFDFEHIAIIEPSTRQDGRRLLETRKLLIEKGFSMWAPCPHQQGCPLLEKNPHDWCHDRIHFHRPDWMIAIEKHLPFQNPTLTFSYLLASRRPRPDRETQIRLVGDLLKEKGKSRQMICRGPEREFFSWLKRDGDAPEFPRGALVRAPLEAQQVGSELRLKSPIEIIPVENCEGNLTARRPRVP